MTLSRIVLAGTVIGLVVGASVACSNTVDGTPMADPNASAASTPNTLTRPPRTIEIPLPSFPIPLPGPSAAPGGPPPTGVLASTCGDYLAMSDSQRKQVIDAIGKDNQLIAMNPELWVGLAGAMCSFTPKATLVKDVLTGQGIR